jgi:hypothetical protein
MSDPDLHLFLIAALHFELATGAHRLKLVPKRLIDFLELRVLFGGAVARQMARAAVVRRVGRAGQIASLLFVLVLPDCITAEIVCQDLSCEDNLPIELRPTGLSCQASIENVSAP